MKYGYFDDSNFEYVITQPDTPRSWSNYIGSRTYGGIVTNNAGGYSFYRSSGAGRFTRLTFNSIPLDQPGRYFYLRDSATGDYWSSAWQPVGKPLDQYQTTTRFGTGYAIIESLYSGIRTETTYLAPREQSFECWKLKVTNEGSTPRKLDIFTYCEFASEWHIFMDAFNLQYSQYVLRNEWKNGFIENSMCGNLPEDLANFKNRDQSRWWWMTLSGATVKGYDLDRETFIGGYRSYHNPEAVEKGVCKNSTAYGDSGCGGLQADIELAPGETKEIVVLLGVGKADREGIAAKAKYADPRAVDAALADIRSYWHSRLAVLTVQTPDEDANHMLNVWGAYNVLMNFYWCRSASLVYSGDERDGYGFRDTVQDMMAAAALIPEEVRERLELMITGQDSLGGAMPEVKPYDHNPGKMPPVNKAHQRSDDMLWFFNTIPAYVNETGDFDFYKKVLPYCDQGEDTVFTHLKKALQFSLTNSGNNGLPCGLYADWDDCIRMGAKGETVMVAFQLRLGLSVYADVARKLGENAEAEWADQERTALDARLQKCWDGEWFIRGIKENGEIIGTNKNDEMKIVQVSQSWSVLSGSATPEQSRIALDSVEKHLETEYGCMSLWPSVVHAECKELRMVLFNPGQKENGGVFGHTQGWVVMANCMIGEGDRAYRVYRANLPSRFNDIAEVRQIEPYVYCQTTSSRQSQREGKSHIPWLTGSASWSYIAPTQYILGIRPELEGLRVDPCIPTDWKGFTATRIYRGKKVSIEVKNPSGKNCGIKKLTLNGDTIEGNLLPLDKLQATNTVVCEIG